MSEDFIDDLFSPFRCKSLSLRNRIVMSPMSRYFSPGGLLGEGMIDYYRRRAEGQVGLIITEGTFVDRPSARNVDVVPVFHGAALGSWERVSAEVHAADCAIAPQLWHAGGLKDFNFPDSPLVADLESPSGLSGIDVPGGRTMSEEDIADVVAAFARGVADCQRLGFDSAEIHGAHGYLFDQFFWSATNQRTDRYGGTTLRERTRFAQEVIRAARRAVGEDFTLIFRISQWKTYFYDSRLVETPESLEQWVGPLADAGVDIFDCSQRRFWLPEFEGSDLNLAGWTKKLTGCPTITVGSIGLSTDLFQDFETLTVSEPHEATIHQAAEKLARGEFDLIAVGRGLLADPEWAAKVRERRFGDLVGYSADLMKRLY